MTTKTVAATGARPAFLESGPKPMLIDGTWVPAASGKTFPSINPATGEALAQVAEGDRADIDRAVTAARRAFEGPWSKFKPFERQQLLLKIADLVERHFDELALLDTLDMGAPISRTRGGRRRVLGMLRYYAGMATADPRRDDREFSPGRVSSRSRSRSRLAWSGRSFRGTDRWAPWSGRSARRWPRDARWC